MNHKKELLGGRWVNPKPGGRSWFMLCAIPTGFPTALGFGAEDPPIGKPTVQGLSWGFRAFGFRVYIGISGLGFRV